MATEGITFGQVVSRGCGIDVHKDTVVATIKGEGIVETTKTFQTFTSSLTDLHDWLKAEGVTHVAMESTGVYWKPVYSVLEESFEVILVNARHIKNVPGHKTDKKDSAWIAKLLLSGLLKASFITLENRKLYGRLAESTKSKILKEISDGLIGQREASKKYNIHQCGLSLS